MTGNSCICIDYDYGGPEFTSERVVQARKTHLCCECGEEISAGSKYQRVVGKWDGDLLTFKTCIPCMNVRNSLMSCGWSYGDLWRDVRDWFWQQEIETENEDGESWLL